MGKSARVTVFVPAQELPALRAAAKSQGLTSLSAFMAMHAKRAADALNHETLVRKQEQFVAAGGSEEGFKALEDKALQEHINRLCKGDAANA